MKSNRTAVVLDGTAGLGLILGNYLANHGYLVAALGALPQFDMAREKSSLDVSSDLYIVETDLSRPESFREKMREAYELIGPIDVLINASDFAAPTSLVAFSPEQWKAIIERDLTAPFFASVAVADFMRPEGGTILNLSSVRAKLAAKAQAAYSAAKAGVAAMTRDLAADLGRKGIKVNSLRLPELASGIGLSHPTTDDICETVGFLISDQATMSIDAFDFPLDDGVTFLRQPGDQDKPWDFEEFTKGFGEATPEVQKSSQVAIVTGAAGGLGKDLALHLVRQGIRCVLLDVLDDEGRKAAAEARTFAQAEYFSCDISSLEDIQKTVARVSERFGRIDILFNAAAVTSRKRTPDISEEDWERFMEIDLKGPYFLSLEAARVMSKTGGGRIINFSSMLSTLAHGRHSLYGSAKEALNSMTRTMAVALSPLDIQVFSVLPAYVMTPMTLFRLEDEEWLVRNYRQSLSKVLLYPEHVSDVFCHLATSQTRATSGQKIYVDTGYMNVRHKLVPWDDPRESARRDMERGAMSKS